MARIEIAYHENSSHLFQKIMDLPWAMFLDSCQPFSNQGRYDILTALPYLTLTTCGENTEIHAHSRKETSTTDPFLLLQEKLTFLKNPYPDLPFAGGALGYFSYDLGRRIEHLPIIAQQDCKIPDMAIGLFAWVIIVDHQLKKSWLVSYDNDIASTDLLQTILQRINTTTQTTIPFKLTQAMQSNLSFTDYAHAFRRIQQYIYDGDCYQVNLAQRFSAEFQGDPWYAYQHLRQYNPAPFAAFLRLPHTTIMSLSPERFLQVYDNQVNTKPIKGTQARGKNPKHDKELAEKLCRSEKDRAENLMIVDLLRNDLGKSCRAGSIQVPKLFALESFASVHHLVSTVIGELAAHKTSLDLLRGCFPGGSITGAPKIRAMEIIEELEPHRRQIYCGSIGYIGFDNNMDTSIAIRTLMCVDNKVYYAAGGGIVADSTLNDEYQETLVKVVKIKEVLEKL